MNMPMNPVARRRLLLLAGLVFAVWASWQVSQEETAATPGLQRPSTPYARSAVKPTVAAAPALNLDWPTRVATSRPVVDPFSLPPKLATAPSGPQAVAAMPVMTLKYVGRLDGSNSMHVFLADAQDRVVSATQGQTVADGWLLSTVDEKKLVFRHTATGHEQTMLTGATQ